MAMKWQQWAASIPGFVVLDGGLGHTLVERGNRLDVGDMWSGRLLVTNPGELKTIARSWLESGADIISTATYQVSLQLLETEFNLCCEEAQEIMRSSWQILDEVRREYWQSLSAAEKQQRRFPGIAISLGPYSAVLKGVHEYSGLYGNVSEDEIYKFHLERTLVMADCIKNNRSRMCDLLCFETIGNATEAMAIGAVMNDERLRTIPFWVSFLCQGRQRIACGDHLSTAVRSTLERCKHKNLVAIGINCVDVYHSGGLVSVVKDTVAGYMGQLDERAWHVAVVAYPNSGEIWSKTGWYWQGGNVISPREWASLVCASGADIVGGCCRIGSSGIHALREESIRIINCERKKGKRTGGLEHTVAISEEEERAEHGRDPVDLIPTPSGR